jgi:HEAT repeat protein
MTTQSDIKKLISDLKSSERQVREQAYIALIKARYDATPYIVEILKSDAPEFRLQAARLLAEIHDPEAIPALVEALMDDRIEVHWAASEALIAQGRDAILPLLKGIIHHFDSYRFRQGAYHVLNTLERSSQLDAESRKVLNALRDVEASVTAPWAAERAIQALEINKK